MRDTPMIVGVGHSCLDRLCTVETYPPEDSSTHITSISVQGGGAVATALAASARLGTPSAMLGYLGADGTGREIRELLDSDGVDTRYIRDIPGGRSSVSYVMVNPAKSTRTKFPYPDDLPPIQWDGELTAALRGAKVLHLDGTQYENALSAAKLAKAAGVTVSLDGCSVRAGSEKCAALAAMADILIMNAKYPTQVTGRADYGEALLEMAGWGPKIVIGTQGARGCLAVMGGQLRRFPAFSVEAVDTTGAGDVFHGAFLAGYLRGMDLEENIRFASAVSAIKCTQIGGRAGIPTLDAAMAFMKAHPHI